MKGMETKHSNKALEGSSGSALKGTVQVPIQRQINAETIALNDRLAIEEPLEICIQEAEIGSPKPISITMRTPGHDQDLALGFAYTEGLISTLNDLKSWGHDPLACAEGNENRFILTFKAGKLPQPDLLQRNFYTTSSCGVCGKASIAALEAVKPAPIQSTQLSFSPGLLKELPAQLRDAQAVFDQTGGLHAAALFNSAAELLELREDVGRHNALDKLIGAALNQRKFDPKRCMLLLSGRASFELVQKALMAGIPAIAAVGAPSSLAVQLASSNGMALAGFVSSEKFNLYCSNDALNLK